MEGCRVWDMDGNAYIDASFMGIGANVLGYANNEIDEAAHEAIRNGGEIPVLAVRIERAYTGCDKKGRYCPGI